MSLPARLRRMAAWGALSWLAVLGRPLWAADCSVSDPNLVTSPGNVITITTVGFTNSEINTAIGYWSGCTEYGDEFPGMQIGGSGGVPVTVQKIVGRSTTQGGGCGSARREIVSGHIESAVITVWTSQADGTSCAPLTDVIAHELGHILGLGDVLDSSCSGHIMGVRVLSTRTVNPDDCAMADDMWETNTESGSGSDPYCNVYCWTSCVNGTCPTLPVGSDPCPILVDLENDGIHLTGLNDPVWFDIDADGQVELISWTDRGEGLLALDRNGNGGIDHGGELFGNHTRFVHGAEAGNGYLALAEFDSWPLGGSEDGQIDASDAVFPFLRMWTDSNHDGISQPAELATLDDARIRRIELDYKRSNRTDRYGNEFRFLGKAWRTEPRNVEHPILTWDVFLLVMP